MSPKSLLHQIGIRPNRKKPAAIEADEGEIVDTMSAEVMNPLFKDEQTAIATLGSNFDRVANSMEKIADSSIFKNKSVKRVADLGGGTGLISIWLSIENYAEQFVVYDYADNPLQFGLKWANDLNAKGITFQRKSYRELADEPVAKFDFVFAEFAAPFDFDLSPDAKVDDFLDPSHCPFLGKYRELASALKNLTAVDGTAFVGTGVITPICAVALCCALREFGLAIDWNQSSNRNGFRLFIKHAGTHLLDKIEDEALAIISDLVEKREFAPCDVLSLEKSFRTGKLYVDIVSEDDNIQYRCSVFQSAGLAGLFQLSSKGHRTVKFYSAGRLPEIANWIIKDASARRVLNKFVDAKLAAIIEN